MLLLSIHDAGPRFADEVTRHVDRFVAATGRHRFAMLVVPDHWGEAPLAGSAFSGKLREWAALGVEMFVHGWFHRDMARHRGMMDRMRARHMTAGEGEFLGLDRAEAAHRMDAGRKLVEDVTGVPAAGFIAPAWLYGEGARAALADQGFALAEDHMRIWSPARSNVELAHGPVITWASRSRGRIASSLLAASVLRHTLAAARVVRLAVHPGDVHVPALEKSIDQTVARLLRSHRPAAYGELLGQPA